MLNVLFISIILVFIDQIIKYLVVLNMSLAESISIIPNFFNLTYVNNTGAAFSLFEGKQIFLILITVISLIGIFYYLKKQTLNKYDILIYSLIISGILANLIDRVFRGYVIDYFDFTIINYHFPVFNFADIFIVVGCIILIIKSIIGDKKC